MNKQQEENFSLDKLRNGDRAEFARVVDAYSEMICRLGLKMLRDAQDAEDVLQETFIKAYENFADFKGNSKVSTWLYRIAHNEALMLIRKRKKPNQFLLDQSLTDQEEQDQEHHPPATTIVDWCCLPEKDLMSNEAMEYLDRAVDQLTEANKSTFLLRDVEGLSTRETADILEISEGAVKTRLSRARLHLRELLSGYYGQQLDTLSLEGEDLDHAQENGKIL